MSWEDIHNKYPGKEFDDVHVILDITPKDTGQKNQWGRPILDYEIAVGGEWRIELPHSCDEWVIGDVEDAKAFRDNLIKAIKYCKKNPIL